MIVSRYVVPRGQAGSLLQESGIASRAIEIMTRRGTIHVVCDCLGSITQEREGRTFPVGPQMVYIAVTSSGESEKVAVHLNTGPLGLIILVTPLLVAAIAALFWLELPPLSRSLDFAGIFARIILLTVVAGFSRSAFRAIYWSACCSRMLRSAG